MKLFLKVALRVWKKHPYTQFFTGISYGVLLFLCMFFYWMIDSFEPVIQQLKKDQVATVFLKPTVTDKEEKNIVDAIQLVMSSQAQVKIVPPEEFIQKLEQADAKLAQEIKGFGEEMLPLIPRFISLNGTLSASQLETIESIPKVESVESSLGRYLPVISVLSTFQKAAILFFVGFIFALLTILFLNSKMNQGQFVESLSLFRSMGADPFFLKIPGILSAWMTVGLGTILCISLWLLFLSHLSGFLYIISPFLKNVKPPLMVMVVVFPIGVSVFLGVIFGLLQSKVLVKKQ